MGRKPRASAWTRRAWRGTTTASFRRSRRTGRSWRSRAMPRTSSLATPPASALVAGDTNSTVDVVHDRSTGLTERVSVDSSGAEGGRQRAGKRIEIAAQSFASEDQRGDRPRRQEPDPAPGTRRFMGSASSLGWCRAAFRLALRVDVARAVHVTQVQGREVSSSNARSASGTESVNGCCARLR